MDKAVSIYISDSNYSVILTSFSHHVYGILYVCRRRHFRSVHVYFRDESIFISG